MKHTFTFVLGIAFACTVASAAAAPGPVNAPQERAGSLQDRRAWVEMSENLSKTVAQANTACGTKITARFDTESFAGVDLFKSRVASHARDAVGALTTNCRDAAGKQAIAARIQRVVVRHSTSGTRLVRSEGLLTVWSDDTKSPQDAKGSNITWHNTLAELL